jgi:hypothetical protein
VPPEDINEERTDAMSKGVELEQGYCHIPAKTCNALSAEPESLGTSEKFGKSASLAGVL